MTGRQQPCVEQAACLERALEPGALNVGQILGEVDQTPERRSAARIATGGPPGRGLGLAVAAGLQAHELALKWSPALGQAVALGAKPRAGVRKHFTVAREFRFDQVAQPRGGLFAGNAAGAEQRLSQALVDLEYRQGRRPAPDVLGQLVPRGSQQLLALLEAPANVAGGALGALGVVAEQLGALLGRFLLAPELTLVPDVRGALLGRAQHRVGVDRGVPAGGKLFMTDDADAPRQCKCSVADDRDACTGISHAGLRLLEVLWAVLTRSGCR